MHGKSSFTLKYNYDDPRLTTYTERPEWWSSLSLIAPGTLNVPDILVGTFLLWQSLDSMDSDISDKISLDAYLTIATFQQVHIPEPWSLACVKNRRRAQILMFAIVFNVGDRSVFLTAAYIPHTCPSFVTTRTKFLRDTCTYNPPFVFAHASHFFPLFPRVLLWTFGLLQESHLTHSMQAYRPLRLKQAPGQSPRSCSTLLNTFLSMYCTWFPVSGSGSVYHIIPLDRMWLHYHETIHSAGMFSNNILCHWITKTIAFSISECLLDENA